jgi:O-antigen/teichoic acid export membrane protein
VLKKLSKDVAIYGSGDFIFRLIGFLVFPVYAHVFSVEEFGVLALITTSAGVVALVASLGLNMAITRYYWDPQTTPAMRPTVVSTGLAVQFVWSTTVVLLVIASIFPAREIIASRYTATWAVIVMALVVVIPDQVLQYCLNVLRLDFSPWKFMFVSFLKNVFSVTVGLVLVLFFAGGLGGLFAGGLAGAFIAASIALVLVRRELMITFHFPAAKRLVAFGYPFIFAGLAYLIFGSVDKWMLVELSNPTQLGLYAIAYKFAGVVLFVNSAFGQAWSPIALKLRRDDAEYRSAYSRVLSVWFFFLVVAGSTITLFGNEALHMLTPREYWAAAPVLAPLIMGIVLSGTTQITAIGISLENRTRLFAFAAWTTALTNVMLNFILIPRWGALGAAEATFLSYGLLTSLYLFWSQRLHPIPLEKPQLLYLVALVVGIAAVSAGGGDASDWSVLATVAKLGLLALIITGGALLGIVNVSSIRKLVGLKRESNNKPWSSS